MTSLNASPSFLTSSPLILQPLFIPSPHPFSMLPEKDQLDNNDDDPHQEHEDRDPVDPMHIFHPLGMYAAR